MVPDMDMARRRVLLGLPWLVGLALAAKHLWAAESPPDRARVLSILARRLFPHRAVSDRAYMAAAAALLAHAEKSAPLSAAIEEGVRSLQQASPGDWTVASEQEQLADIKRIESSAFFAAAYQHLLTSIYRDPEVWRVIGYEGSSVEHGGYLERGFDDIDWLPKE